MRRNDFNPHPKMGDGEGIYNGIVEMIPLAHLQRYDIFNKTYIRN